MNSALVNLIADQFWSVKGDAVRMGSANNKYLDFPDPLLAMCASGVGLLFSTTYKILIMVYS